MARIVTAKPDEKRARLEPAIATDGTRPRAAAEPLLTNDSLLVRCGRPETSIAGIVFEGRRGKRGDISTWKF